MRIILLSLLLAISGCSYICKDKPPVIKYVQQDKVPLNLEKPDPVKLDAVYYYVVTPENAQKKFAELEAKGLRPVIIGTSAVDYQKLSTNERKMRVYMQKQNYIIIKYKDYYEPHIGK